jgi:hypothetical protein
MQKFKSHACKLKSQKCKMSKVLKVDNWHEKGENDSWKTAHGRRERVVMELIAVLRSINDPTSEFEKIASHLHDLHKLKRSTTKQKKLRRIVSQTVAAATAAAFAHKTLGHMIF